MEGLPVSYSLNSGDNGNNWWGDFIGAAIGGAAGAAWGRGNNNGCCGEWRWRLLQQQRPVHHGHADHHAYRR